jgi:hypothetical protein
MEKILKSVILLVLGFSYEFFRKKHFVYTNDNFLNTYFNKIGSNIYLFLVFSAIYVIAKNSKLDFQTFKNVVVSFSVVKFVIEVMVGTAMFFFTVIS